MIRGLVRTIAKSIVRDIVLPDGGLVFGVLDSDGNAFHPSLMVLDSDGNSFSVSHVVLNSSGTAFVAI